MNYNFGGGGGLGGAGTGGFQAGGGFQQKQQVRRRAIERLITHAVFRNSKQHLIIK